MAPVPGATNATNPDHGGLDEIFGSMEPTSKKLRPYQVRLVTDVCRATEDVLVEQPTGSGKTVQIVTLVAMHLGRRFSHALISAPQEQIASQVAVGLSRGARK